MMSDESRKNEEEEESDELSMSRDRVQRDRGDRDVPSVCCRPIHGLRSAVPDVMGQPNLQGICDFRSITPLQRPEEMGDKEFLTAEEAANLEQETVDRNERLLNRPARRTKAAGRPSLLGS